MLEHSIGCASNFHHWWLKPLHRLFWVCLRMSSCRRNCSALLVAVDPILPSSSILTDLSSTWSI